MPHRLWLSYSPCREKIRGWVVNLLQRTHLAGSSNTLSIGRITPVLGWLYDGDSDDAHPTPSPTPTPAVNGTVERPTDAVQQPGFGAGMGVVAVLAAALLARRRE